MGDLSTNDFRGAARTPGESAPISGENAGKVASKASGNGEREVKAAFPEKKILSCMWTGIKPGQFPEGLSDHTVKPLPGERHIFLGPFKLKNPNPEVEADEKAYKKERKDKKEETQRQIDRNNIESR